MPAFANSSTADTSATYANMYTYGDITHIFGFWHHSCELCDAQQNVLFILWGQDGRGCMYAIGNEQYCCLCCELLDKTAVVLSRGQH